MVSRVTLLGSTGSIGENTLDIVRRHPDRFRIFALSAHRRIDKLFEQCVEFTPQYAVVGDESLRDEFQARIREHRLATSVITGNSALIQVCEAPGVNVVVTGIVGAAGLLPTWSAVKAGKRVLIANKEPLVMMGREIIAEARRSNAEIIPLDSEHNALFQCLPNEYRIGGATGFQHVRRILLTGSGGPLRKMTAAQLQQVTPEQAIAHPNWSMGPKISVDSATLMNKGLELIEACCLFSVSAQDVEVVIHPQSTIHSMIEYNDGSIIAQMGNPDMRIPIAHGLGWPERIESGAGFLDFASLKALEFEAPDVTRFPCLDLAREVADLAGTAPSILNAANEVAVELFLDCKILFTSIPVIIEHTLNQVSTQPNQSLDSVLEADRCAREVATRFAQVLTRKSGAN